MLVGGGIIMTLILKPNLVSEGLRLFLKYKISTLMAITIGAVLTVQANPSIVFAEIPVPAISETGDESAHVVMAESIVPGDPSFEATTYELEQDTNLWYEVKDVLHLRIEVPAGTRISIPKNHEFSIMKYRTATGKIENSTTGFINPIRIVSVPREREKDFPQNRIRIWNETPGGLFVTAAIIGRVGGTKGEFAPIDPASPGAGFRRHFDSSGRPLDRYTETLRTRFGRRLNAKVDSTQQNGDERIKWRKILKELEHASVRTIPSSKAIIIVPLDQAKRDARAFEKNGVIPLYGAWTIATMVTARRHGFADRPCAETMSEFIREAYQRAGYDVNKDFNSSKGNRLFWSETASVEGLSRSLADAGWVPWDAAEFRPPPGAVMMKGAGTTPGHTYISAGDHGRLIVDNGAPQGRDLRATKEKTVANLYKTGVFFLPPGINPQRW
jgi:hypothetical protein